MPCNDGGPVYSGESWELREQRKKIDDLTALLCEACKHIPPGNMPPAVGKWYAAHLEWDRKREEQEALMVARIKAKQAALAKLTPEDRQILGL
jgi:hypothetical protein